MPAPVIAPLSRNRPCLGMRQPSRNSSGGRNSRKNMSGSSAWPRLNTPAIRGAQADLHQWQRQRERQDPHQAGGRWRPPPPASPERLRSCACLHWKSPPWQLTGWTTRKLSQARAAADGGRRPSAQQGPDLCRAVEARRCPSPGSPCRCRHRCGVPSRSAWPRPMAKCSGSRCSSVGCASRSANEPPAVVQQRRHVVGVQFLLHPPDERRTYGACPPCA